MNISNFKYYALLLLFLSLFLGCDLTKTSAPKAKQVPEQIDISEFNYNISYEGSIQIKDNSGIYRRNISSVVSKQIPEIDPISFHSTGRNVGIKFIVKFENFTPIMTINFTLNDQRQYILEDQNIGIGPESGIQWKYELSTNSSFNDRYEEYTTSTFSLTDNYSLKNISVVSSETYYCQGLSVYHELLSKYSDIEILDVDLDISLTDDYYLIENIESNYSYNQLIGYNTRNVLSRINDSEVFNNPGVELQKFIDNIKQIEPDKGAQIIIFYDWIKNSIYYDYDFYLGNSSETAILPNELLLEQKTVCSGYANLLSEMCSLAGFSAKKIYGFAGQISGTTHAWSAVKINNEVYMLDATWDSRNSYQNNTYTTNPGRRSYLLKSPGLWKYLRYPNNPNYQFVNTTISQQEYESNLSNYNYNIASIRDEGLDENLYINGGVDYVAVDGDINIIVEHPANTNLFIGGFQSGTVTIDHLSSTITNFKLTYSDLSVGPEYISLQLVGSSVSLALIRIAVL